MSNGKLRYEIPYQNSKLHGIMKGWYFDGKCKYEAYYLYDKEVTKEEYDKHELIESLAQIK